MRYYVKDPRPNQNLSDIDPMSVRAQAWLARVISNVPDDKQTQLIGVIPMLQGLDYHCAQFMCLCHSLQNYYSRMLDDAPSKFTPIEAETKALDGLDHEATAYLNRLGQFLAYAKACKIDDRLEKARELLVFRNKHTAHRSIDAPGTEPPEEREGQAMAIGFYRSSCDGFPIYQISSGGKRYDFQMHRDHPLVMQQALDALFTLYPLLDPTTSPVV